VSVSEWDTQREEREWSREGGRVKTKTPKEPAKAWRPGPSFINAFLVFPSEHF
jgi:hypothetical protein